MNKELIIQDEAKRAVHRFGSFEANYNGHIDYIEFVKLELARYYKPVDKAIFLDAIKTGIEQELKEHQERCTKGGNCAFDLRLNKVIYFLQQEIDELPTIIHENVVQNQSRNTVFISYSHADAKWLEVFRRHFRALEGKVHFWDDSQIKPGQKWADEIDAAMSRAKVAILFISTDFFNSDFITRKETPRLLKAAQEDGATIMNVFVKPAALSAHPEIMQYQGINAPSKLLAKMDDIEADELFVAMITHIQRIFEESGML